MQDIRSFYCIIQYVPDAGRAEAANVGVVLFMPAKREIGIRTSPTLERVRRFFEPGELQLQRIRIAIESLQSRLLLDNDEFADEREIAQFVAARADAVRLTPPRLAIIRDPVRDLDELYSELVEDTVSVRAERKLSLSRRNGILKWIRKFARYKIAPKSQKSSSSSVPRSKPNPNRGPQHSHQD